MVIAEGGGGYAVLIALVATHWNRIEQSLGIMYTWLLRGQEPSAFEFYHDLIDISLKEKAFKAAAKDKLPRDLIDEVSNFFVELRRLSKRRADIIHGTWAVTPDKPSSLLLVDHRLMNQQLNKMLRYVVDIQNDASAAKDSISFDILPEDFKEYSIRDFQSLLADLTAADIRAQDLGQKVLAHALTLGAKSR